MVIGHDTKMICTTSGDNETILHLVRKVSFSQFSKGQHHLFEMYGPLSDKVR